MAKFSRHDPRNKKRNKHKFVSRDGYKEKKIHLENNEDEFYVYEDYEDEETNE